MLPAHGLAAKLLLPPGGPGALRDPATTHPWGHRPGSSGNVPSAVLAHWAAEPPGEGKVLAEWVLATGPASPGQWQERVAAC